MFTIVALNWTGPGALTVNNADFPESDSSTVSWLGTYDSTPTQTTSVISTSIDGQITLTNDGVSPVDILLNAQGWFGASNDQQQDRAILTSARAVGAGTGNPADQQRLTAAGIADDVNNSIPVGGEDEEDTTSPDDLVSAIRSCTSSDNVSGECRNVAGKDGRVYASSTVVTTCPSGSIQGHFFSTSTAKNIFGVVLYKWTHRIYYCFSTSQNKVTKWRGRTDFVTQKAPLVTDNGTIKADQSTAGSSQIWSYRKHHLQYCLGAKYGCIYDYTPSSKLWVNGQNSKWIADVSY